MTKLNLIFIAIVFSFASSALSAKGKIYEGAELFDLWVPKGIASVGKYEGLGCRSIVDATPEDKDIEGIPYAKVKVTINNRGALKKPELLETGNGATSDNMTSWIEFNKLPAFHYHFKTSDGKKKGKKVKAIITLYFKESDECK